MEMKRLLGSGLESGAPPLLLLHGSDSTHHCTNPSEKSLSFFGVEQGTPITVDVCRILLEAVSVLPVAVVYRVSHAGRLTGKGRGNPLHVVSRGSASARVSVRLEALSSKRALALSIISGTTGSVFGVWDSRGVGGGGGSRPPTRPIPSDAGVWSDPIPESMGSRDETNEVGPGTPLSLAVSVSVRNSTSIGGMGSVAENTRPPWVLGKAKVLLLDH
jgi:hypothetical protein